ncbi:putative molybdenum hydroxylase family fusion protein of CoxS-like and CoxG-like proteins [Octadecabacter arcticus 238]|jgi:carbon-monoxide dehydrogenase small subunit|uniref:Putative molybdenum hydroxylase family fusion protein of CoxS-like and CoxG-like proteins n=1 Tax=Octadecabacter arcticus 238 TaxID=391616 RepID=M9RFU5_9RHOB|nr:2Fe-2S iron-sulfur cluster-binding protein [Octadecabacter arcticus]AGI71037.1 putative molybdenum hydroxylase family fusion protein of CoxS-like and CoxG-like proteins [Octadecabacter arcticus 238]
MKVIVTPAAANQSISLTINDRPETVTVPPRTTLAEILRDHLDLTATHLGCEQGVCGACTVMVDGRPTRACLTFAASCEGATVETLEGFKDDDLMDRLKAAFHRNHALQCGFCTPGVLATARDLVERLDTADEVRIRNELSGNLCRCTGYVGIVESIAQVIDERRGLGLPSTGAPRVAREATTGFAPFDADIAERPPAPAVSSGTMTVEDGWSVVKREVALNHSADAVWAHFSDLDAVAECLPGAKLTDHDASTFTGHIGVAFGPITAKFEGEGTYRTDDSSRVGTVAGRGKDRGGQSAVEGELSYTVRLAQGDPDASLVDVGFRFRIQGMLGQFNRPELVNGFVDYILAEFVANCDAVLSGGEVRESKGISAFAMIRAVIGGKLRALFRRT